MYAYDASGWVDSGLYKMCYCYKDARNWKHKAWALINGSGTVAYANAGYTASANSASVLKVLIKNWDYGSSDGW